MDGIWGNWPQGRRVDDGSLAERIERLGEHSRQGQTSPKGAAGVMQLMPDTGRQAAAYLGVPFSESSYRRDAHYNRMLGGAWVHRLLTKYGGDETLAAEAYNAGEGVVDDWISGLNRSGKNRSRLRLGDPRKGEISDLDFAKRTPFAETRDYALRVGNMGPQGFAPMQGKVDVNIRIAGAPPGTSVTTKSQGGARATGTVQFATLDIDH